ncbi:MAG TPA: DUF58 domain-containing protein [Candidatus Methanoperedens sp.]|nr:DUF58 domain-containing protein [Candidatus Methanoperedens sp.]
MIPREVLRKVRQIEIRTNRLVSDVFGGEYHSVFKGQGMEFQEVRQYVAGDDVRAIDWNVSARGGELFVKKFTEERELTVLLLVDVSASQFFGGANLSKKDLAAEIAAVLAFAAIRNNDRVGLVLFTDEVELYVPPRKGSSHVLRVIREVLSCAPRSRGTRLAASLEFLNRVMHRRAVAFLISDFLGSGFERQLRVTARRHDLICVVTGDRLERAWPAAGLVDWTDTESGERRILDTSSREVRDALGRIWAERRRRLLDALRGARSDAVEVFAGEPYERQLIAFFKLRERRLRR